MKTNLLRNALLVMFVFASFFGQGANQAGDTITIDGKKFRLLSANLITNPGFEDNFTGWTDATPSAAVLTAAKFSISATGGVGNSKYLIGLNNENASSSGSIGTGWSISSGKSYLFAYQVKYLDATAAAGSEPYLKVSRTNDKTSSVEPNVLINSTQVNGNGAWTQNYVYFTNSNPSYNYIVVRFRWLSNRFGFDDFMLYEAAEVVDIPALQAAIKEAQTLYNPAANGADALLAAITTAQGYLSSTSATAVSGAIADLQKAIQNYKYANASSANPIDMTDFMVNPSFESGFTGWTNVGFATQSNAYFPGKKGTYYIEKWVNRGSKITDVSIQQTLSNLPNGRYVLSAVCGNIQQSSSGSSINAGNPQTGTILFADNYAVAVDTIKDRSLAFIVINNQVTIGLKAESATGNWVTCDNFRLKYVGPYTVEDYAVYLNNYIASAQKLLAKKMQNTARQGLNTAIGQAQQAANASPLVSSDLSAAKVALDNAIAAANVSVQLYADLQTAMDYANKVLNWYQDDQVKKDKMQTAINTANASLNNDDLTSTEITKAVSDLQTVTKSVDKQIYIASWSLGDVNNNDNAYSYKRSKQSKNWILFWEKGYGDNPTTFSCGSYTVDIDEVLRQADISFNFYTDSLKFITRGSSKTDTYKMVIKLRYSTEWEASGSGVDDKIGLLTLTPWAAPSRSWQTLYHEIGHCFQYQTHCDNNNFNGWMYGFGDNASGGCGWWEQCAQWQAYKILPAQQFTNEWFSGYLSRVHKHILHETPRYENYFIQDYWCYLHGMDMIGRLWNKSVKPEDPVETYKRLNAITQSQFNDELWDCAARFATWDIPALKSYGAGYIASRPQPKMNNMGNYVWRIDSTVCIENYGHNIIKLNAPATATTVYATFEGLAGTNGFRKNYVSYAGWRYGFVALLKNGTRVYGDMKSANMTDNGGKGSVRFNCPANCDKLWFVVSGAPSVHWRHAWDDNDANDEQWPYQVSFGNTNLYGYANVVASIDNLYEKDIDISVKDGTLSISGIPDRGTVRIYDTLGRCVQDKKINEAGFTTGLPKGFYIVSVKIGQNVVTRKILVQ